MVVEIRWVAHLEEAAPAAVAAVARPEAEGMVVAMWEEATVVEAVLVAAE